MAQGKWLKLGAAGVLSIGMLAACGSNEPAENNEDPEMQNEEDSNMEDSESEDEDEGEEEDSEEED